MNFVGTAAYKGIRFETKQNLDFKPTIIHFNIWTSLVLTIQGFFKMETIRHQRYLVTNLVNLKKKISLIYRGLGDLQINEITQYAPFFTKPKYVLYKRKSNLNEMITSLLTCIKVFTDYEDMQKDS